MFLIVLSNWTDFLNYPGLELWKFINLAVFVGAGIYILRKPIATALSARAESIRRQIKQAEEDKKAAEEKLAEADAQLARLDADIQSLRQQAEKEVALERERLAATAANEIEKLKSQADRELDNARKVAKKELRQFLAQRSMDLAKATVVSRLDPDADVRLIKERVVELGRVRG
jgi:F-type H+-transporting ATPase subunit b